MKNFGVCWGSHHLLSVKHLVTEGCYIDDFYVYRVIRGQSLRCKVSRTQIDRMYCIRNTTAIDLPALLQRMAAP